MDIYISKDEIIDDSDRRIMHHECPWGYCDSTKSYLMVYDNPSGLMIIDDNEDNEITMADDRVFVDTGDVYFIARGTFFNGGLQMEAGEDVTYPLTIK